MNFERKFVNIGEIYVTQRPTEISTVLGPCVSVCLYNKERKIGGMNHFILPFWDGDALCSPRYGNIAIPQLVKAFLRLDCQHNSLEAKVFGAAYTLPSQAADRDENHHNGLVTQKLLKELGIPIIAMDFGGDRGRHITFNTETGKVALKYLEKRSFT